MAWNIAEPVKSSLANSFYSFGSDGGQGTLPTNYWSYYSGLIPSNFTVDTLAEPICADALAKGKSNPGGPEYDYVKTQDLMSYGYFKIMQLNLPYPCGDWYTLGLNKWCNAGTGLYSVMMTGGHFVSVVGGYDDGSKRYIGIANPHNQIYWSGVNQITIKIAGLVTLFDRAGTVYAPNHTDRTKIVTSYTVTRVRHGGTCLYGTHLAMSGSSRGSCVKLTLTTWSDRDENENEDRDPSGYDPRGWRAVLNRTPPPRPTTAAAPEESGAAAEPHALGRLASLARVMRAGALPAERAAQPEDDGPRDPALAAAETRFDEIARGLDPEIASKLAAKTPLGRRIARLAMFVRLGEKIDKETGEQLRGAYAALLRAHPSEAQAEIRGFMGRLDSLKYAEERLSLYSVLTAVPDVRNAMEELSRRDITAMVPPAPRAPKSEPATIEEQQALFSWPPSRILPVMAYNYFAVATKDDPDAALEGTIAAITAQADPTIQTGMATGFVTAHPEMKPALYAALSQKNVALPNVEPMNQAAPPPVDTTAPSFKPVVAPGG